MKKPFWIGAGVLIVLLVVGGAWWLWHVSSGGFFAAPSQALSASTTSAPVALQPHRVAPPGTKEWYDEHYRFSLFYPSELTEKKYDEGADATTYTFQNIEKAEGFQIFIVPYGATQVTEAQFQRDEPSGVRKGVRAATIGGTPGAVFYSMNLPLGETYEMWFIKNGYLYEVTAPKSAEAWLNGVMSTWIFL